MSKKITFNIPNDYELSSIFNNIDKFTSSLNININIEPKKRSIDQSFENQKLWNLSFQQNNNNNYFDNSINNNNINNNLNQKTKPSKKDNQSGAGIANQYEEPDIIQTTPPNQQSSTNFEETINGLTESEIRIELENQFKQSLKELHNDSKYICHAEESYVLYSLNENSIKEIADYLDEYIIIVDGCHILPPNVKNVETIGRFNFFRLKDRRQLKLNLVYWYLNTTHKKGLYRHLTCTNRCPNSYCLNPEHIILETRRLKNPRSVCLKNNATLLEKFNQECQRLKDEGVNDPNGARTLIDNFKCKHRIKCIGEFIE